MKEFKITHLTSVHPRYDTRIFIKMCTSLAANGYKVSLIVADGLKNEVKNNVNIIDVGVKSGGRLSRMTKTVRRVYEKAKNLDTDIYHLHDPELMPIGLKLKNRGKKVIFDAHEDLPKQLLGKPYINPIAKLALSKILEVYERLVCPRYDAVITATPFIRNKFLKINPNTVDINNFPLLEELTNACDWEKKQNEVAYVGGITKIRGIEEVLQSLEYTQGISLNLAGKFSEAAVEVNVKKSPAWSKVNELGFLNREQVRAVLAKSKLGIVTFHAAPNHIDAQPNKMFEYMSASLPIITSNFPLWLEIVEGNQCGLCLDPLDNIAIGKAIQYLIDHPAQAEQMGKNGRKAVVDKYNWPIEEKKLLKLYKVLTK